MDAPIKYFGGKGGMIQTLLRHFPDASSYDVFIDAYGGSGVVLLTKPACKVEVYNDLDKNVYSLFETLRHPGKFSQFQHLCELALYDQHTSDEYRKSLRTADLEEVERAFRFWYVNRTRHNGVGGFSINKTVRRRMSKSTSDFLSSVEDLLPLHERLSSVVVSNRDSLDLIRENDTARTLLYLDPPYVQSTRTSTRYTVDADDVHHKALVEALNGLKKAKVVLSGYENPIYTELVGFNKTCFKVNTVSGTRAKKTKTETVWTNFDDLETLPLFAGRLAA